MPDLIDYDFISQREGGRVTTAYVPAAKDSKSGVTIATGFDLGARNIGDLNRLGLEKSLCDKLTPYLGKSRQTAIELLAKSPLSITEDEAKAIDTAVKKKETDVLKTRYLTATDNVSKKDFFELPTEAQTVIASVSFQYGDLSKVAPRFWTAATAQNWAETLAVLRNYGDIYRTRRNLEADVLAKLVPVTDIKTAGKADAGKPAKKTH